MQTSTAKQQNQHVPIAVDSLQGTSVSRTAVIRTPICLAAADAEVANQAAQTELMADSRTAGCHQRQFTDDGICLDGSVSE